MVATVLSRAQHGMEAPLVRVEVHLGNGLPRVTIVGLPEAVVKESRDRVHAAVLNCGLRMPDGRVTINLSPADVPKEGVRSICRSRSASWSRRRAGRAAALRELGAVRRVVARRRDSSRARRAARGNRGRACGSSHDRAAGQRRGDLARVGLSRRSREASARCRRTRCRLASAGLREWRVRRRSSPLSILTCATCTDRRKRNARSRSLLRASTAW